MSRLSEFIVKMPELCGATNVERWSELLKMQFEKELRDPASVWKRNAADERDPANRLATAFVFPGDEEKIAQCKRLCELAILAHYRKEHGEKQWDDRIRKVEFEAFAREPDFPEIEAAYSVEEASAGGWGV